MVDGLVIFLVILLILLIIGAIIGTVLFFRSRNTGPTGGTGGTNPNPPPPTPGPTGGTGSTGSPNPAPFIRNFYLADSPTATSVTRIISTINNNGVIVPYWQLTPGGLRTPIRPAGNEINLWNYGTFQGSPFSLYNNAQNTMTAVWNNPPPQVAKPSQSPALILSSTTTDNGLCLAPPTTFTPTHEPSTSYFLYSTRNPAAFYNFYGINLGNNFYNEWALAHCVYTGREYLYLGSSDTQQSINGQLVNTVVFQQSASSVRIYMIDATTLNQVNLDIPPLSCPPNGPRENC